MQLESHDLQEKLYQLMLLILDYDSGCVPVVCFGLSHANVKNVV